jgi:hypothetical protein
MAITDILSAAQGGQFFQNVANAVGLDEAATKAAISVMATAIAAKLKDKAAADPEAFETLVDLLEDGDGSDINDPDAITGAEALSDGKEILADIYGSPDAAHAALTKLTPDLQSSLVSKLAAISATSVLAALSASNSQSLASDEPQAAASSGGGGFFSVLLAAIFKGLLQGASRQLAPKRRRRRRYSNYYGYARKRPTRRRKRKVGLDDVFRDILGGRR